MRYMMLIYSRETAEPPRDEARSALMEAHWALGREARQAGVLLGGAPLAPTSTATTIRSREGQTLITDGPFAETKEQLAGYYIFECATLDEAIEWAKKIPTGCLGSPGSLEIRPLREVPQCPDVPSLEPAAAVRA